MSQQNELPKAILNEAGLATQAGWLTVYSIESVQREYQQTSLEYLPEGVGLPALSFVDKPTVPKPGMALVRSADGSAWETLPDYRGQTAYNTQTGQPEAVTLIGELPKKLTLATPSTFYDKWDGQKWVTDTAAQQEAAVSAARDELARRQRMAAERITLLDDAVSLGMATDAEISALQAWKVYRVQLSRINPGDAPNIIWPNAPETP